MWRFLSDRPFQWRIQDFPGGQFQGGANLLFGIIFAESCMKMNKNGLREGMSPLSATAFDSNLKFDYFLIGTIADSYWLLVIQVNVNWVLPEWFWNARRWLDGFGHLYAGAISLAGKHSRARIHPWTISIYHRELNYKLFYFWNIMIGMIKERKQVEKNAQTRTTEEYVQNTSTHQKLRFHWFSSVMSSNSRSNSASHVHKHGLWIQGSSIICWRGLWCLWRQ